MNDITAMTSYPDTFHAIEEVEVGTILRDWREDGIRCLIMRGPASLCVYLGIPSTHPLAGVSYDDVNIDCHGGLTFARAGDGKRWPEAYYWFGYDYAHAGDASIFESAHSRAIMDRVNKKFPNLPPDKRWTVGEIVKDTCSAVYDLRKVMRLAEQMYNKGRATSGSAAP